MQKPDRNDHAAAVAYYRWFARRVRRGTYRRPEPQVVAPALSSASELMTADEALELKVKTKGETLRGRQTPRGRL